MKWANTLQLVKSWESSLLGVQVYQASCLSLTIKELGREAVHMCTGDEAEIRWALHEKYHGNPVKEG